MTEPWLLYSINKKLSTFCRLAQLLMTLGDLWGSFELLYRPSLYCGNSAWHTGQLLQNSWTDRVILEWRLPSTYLTQYYKASIIVLISFLTLIFPSIIKFLSSLVLSCMFLPHSWSLSHTPCSWLWQGSQHWHIFCSLQTWLLQFYILKSLHWLKVQERIEYRVIFTTYRLLQPSSPRYLRDLITVQPSRSTRSSALVIFLQPSVDPSLKITIRTSLADQAFSHSSWSLSIRSFVITQLFSIVMLWSWTAFWHFLWRFPLSS